MKETLSLALYLSFLGLAACATTMDTTPEPSQSEYQQRYSAEKIEEFDYPVLNKTTSSEFLSTYSKAICKESLLSFDWKTGRLSSFPKGSKDSSDCEKRWFSYFKSKVKEVYKFRMNATDFRIECVRRGGCENLVTLEDLFKEKHNEYLRKKIHHEVELNAERQLHYLMQAEQRAQDQRRQSEAMQEAAQQISSSIAGRYRRSPSNQAPAEQPKQMDYTCFDRCLGGGLSYGLCTSKCSY